MDSTLPGVGDEATSGVGEEAASEVGDEASAVGEGAGGSVGFTWPVHPTTANIMSRAVGIAHFERYMLWLFIRILLT